MAKGLLPLVNSEEYDELMEYIDYRIDSVRAQLENTIDTHTIYRHQGALSELRLMKRMRDSVNQMKNQG
jgi:hypothetical protein